MTDLAQLGLSLDAQPMLKGLGAVDAALDKTAARAEALVAKIKTATGQMAAAFSKVKDGGAEKQAASMEKMNLAIEHQAKAYRALLAVMREDSAIAKSSAAQRILLNSAFASGTAEIDKATIAGAKNLAGLRSETAATTSLAVAQGGLTASEKQLLDAKIRKSAVTKAYTDSVRAEIAGATQQVALSNAHVAAYHRETAAIKERNAALAAERKMQADLGRDIIAMQGRQNASLGLSSAGKDLFAPFAKDPKVLAASKQQVALSAEHTAALKREEAATKSLADREAARAKQAMTMRMQPILSTGSVGLPTKATSAFNQPEAPLYTASGIASVDKMRESLARLRAEEAALHAARQAGTITHLEYARGMDGVTKATNLAVAGNTRARGVFRQTASAIASATFEVTGAVFGITSALSILASPAVFGFGLLKTLEDTKLGMGAILISMGEINGEAIKLPQALELADGMTKRLQQNAMKYGVDMIALADTTKAVLASGLGGGLALKEVEEIALLGSIAVKTIGLDAKQSVQEIRDLVAGGIQAGSSTLAVALGIGNKQVKEWREAGTLFENLKKSMVGFQETAILKQDTLNGAWTIFVQKVQLLLANGPAFDLIKQKLTDISNALGGFNADTGQFEFNPELVKTVEDYYAAFKKVIEVLVDAGKVLVAITPYVVEFAKGWLMLKGYTLARGLVTGVVEIGASLVTSLASLTTFRGELGKLNTMKSPVIRIGVVLAAWEAGQTVGTWLYEKFQTEIGAMFEPINKLFYNFGKNWGATLADGVAASLKQSMSVQLPKGLKDIFSVIGVQAEVLANRMRAPKAAPAPSSLLSKWGGGGKTQWEKVDPSAFVTGKPQPTDSDKKDGTGAGAVDPQIAFMENLRKEAATLGMSEEALKRYEVSKMKLTATNRRLADQYVTAIFKFKAEQEAAKLANEEAQKSLDVQDKLIEASHEKVASVEKELGQIQFETTLLGMNTEERYRAIAAREVESNIYTEGNVQLAERIALLKKEQEYNSRVTSLLAGTQKSKTEDFMADVAAADRFRFDGGDQQQADEMIKNITDGTKDAKDKLSELDQFTSKMAKNIQNSMADFLFDPFDKGLKGMLQGFGTMLQRMIAEAVAADLAKKMFGGLADDGATGGNGWIGAGLDWLGGLFASANGNAFAGGSPVQAFASGGILGANGGMLTRPTLFPMANGGIGLGGEAGVEAVMPLKRGSDGKLGVAAGGGSRNNITVIVQGGQSAPDVRRAAGQGAREALGLINGAKRYG